MHTPLHRRLMIHWACAGLQLLPPKNLQPAEAADAVGRGAPCPRNLRCPSEPCCYCHSNREKPLDIKCRLHYRVHSSSGTSDTGLAASNVHAGQQPASSRCCQSINAHSGLIAISMRTSHRDACYSTAEPKRTAARLLQGPTMHNICKLSLMNIGNTIAEPYATG